MRRTIAAIVVLLVLTAGYSAWPFYGLYRIARAAQDQDIAALNERVDFPALRRSLAEQIIRTYMRLTGIEANPLVQGLALAVGSGIADPIVAQLVSPATVAELLRTGWPSAVLGETPAGVEGLLGAEMFSSGWRLYGNSKYGFGEFRIWLPAGKPTDQQFRLRLSLSGVTWRVSGLLLPVHVQERLVRELIKARDAWTERPR